MCRLFPLYRRSRLSHKYFKTLWKRRRHFVWTRTIEMLRLADAIFWLWLVLHSHNNTTSHAQLVIKDSPSQGMITMPTLEPTCDTFSEENGSPAADMRLLMAPCPAPSILKCNDVSRGRNERNKRKLHERTKPNRSGTRSSMGSR